MEYVFYILLAVALVFGPIVLSIIAIAKVSSLRRELAALSAQIDVLAEAAPAPYAPPVAEAVPTQEPVPGAETPAAEAVGEGEPEQAPQTEEEIAAPAAARQGLEERIASRWMVWLGALTVSLAGVFLVKYASESGLLGPAVRVALGFALGVVLAIAGEWVRRHPEHGRYVRAQGSFIAPALTAAGIFVAFASVYAAHALYGLIPGLVAFALLGGVALLGFALSLLQGPFVALVGLSGAFTTPLLVEADAPGAWSLFLYLLVIVAASLALVRYRRWWWLSFASIAGGCLWAFLWLASEHQPSDALPVGGYLVAILAMFLFFWHGIEDEPREGPWYTAFLRYGTYVQASWVGAFAVAFLTPIYMEASDYSNVAAFALGAACLVCAARAWDVERLEGILVLFALVTLALVSTWRIAPPDPYANPFPLPGGARLMGPVLAPELVPYVTVAGAFAALFGLGGFFAAWHARRTAVWAGLACAVPIGILVLAYFRIGERVTDVNWSLIALALALAYFLPFSRFLARREEGTSNDALGLSAAAIVACLCVACAMILDRALLTVVLSAMLPALAWIDERLKVVLLRWVAGVLAGVVLVRLALNWNVFDYPIGRELGANWVLYGYGIPAVAFFVAARWFARSASARLVTLLDAGALLFFVLLVSLELRTLFEGSLDARSYRLFEASLQSLAWLVIAASRIRACAFERRFVALWGGRILFVLAFAHVALAHLIVLNPVRTLEPVGAWPVLNLLAVAYLLPVPLLLYCAPRLAAIGLEALKRPAQVLSFVLVFVYVTLEVQRVFQGEVLSGWPLSDAEVWAYSVAWLVLALALLAMGIVTGAKAVRHAALVALLATVLKVFLYDMDDLTGLWRVASFLGLGLSLIGIGYVYQRFVFPRATPPAAPAAEET